MSARQFDLTGLSATEQGEVRSLMTKMVPWVLLPLTENQSNLNRLREVMQVRGAAITLSPASHELQLINAHMQELYLELLVPIIVHVNGANYTVRIQICKAVLDIATAWKLACAAGRWACPCCGAPRTYACHCALR